MSLLIKALDKAEKAQEEQLKSQKPRRRRAANIANHDVTLADEEVDLQLARPEHNLTQEFYSAQYATEANERAANVFEAKQSAVSPSVPPLVWIAGLGLLGLLAIGGYFYYQLNHMNTPPVVVPAEQVVVTPNQPEEPSLTIADSAENTTQDPIAHAPATADQRTALAVNQALPPETNPTAEAPLVDNAPLFDDKTEKSVKRTTTKREKASLAFGEEKIEPKSSLSFGAPIASESVSIHISKSKTALGLNPNLVSAYNAYTTGRDSEAQALYKKVLQQDTRNVDALLGMAAIAERQGRLSDAQGWYQKVLELEPRNAIALASYYDNQQSDEHTATHFKNLIAKEPTNANLHAGLGGLYAEQNQWPDAQQAYFEAYRLNPSAENAFNLAVSLDQMGKPTLALPYYQQALALTNSQPSGVIDRTVLQQRISAIETAQ